MVHETCMISLDFMAHEIALEVGNVLTTDLSLMGKESYLRCS